MNEKNELNEVPLWAQELINNVNDLKKKVNETFPEQEKKPDFSAFVEKLKFRGEIPEDK